MSSIRSQIVEHLVNIGFKVLSKESYFACTFTYDQKRILFWNIDNFGSCRLYSSKEHLTKLIETYYKEYFHLFYTGIPEGVQIFSTEGYNHSCKLTRNRIK